MLPLLSLLLLDMRALILCFPPLRVAYVTGFALILLSLIDDAMPLLRPPLLLLLIRDMMMLLLMLLRLITFADYAVTFRRFRRH